MAASIIIYSLLPFYSFFLSVCLFKPAVNILETIFKRGTNDRHNYFILPPVVRTECIAQPVLAIAYFPSTIGV